MLVNTNQRLIVFTKKIVEDARKEASIIIEKSKVEIDRERNKAEDDIKNQVVDLQWLFQKKCLENQLIWISIRNLSMSI